MEIKIYDTLKQDKVVFKPLKNGEVGMYHCGPTVYDHPHIGNLRAYVFADTLRRMFEYNDYKVNQVINITDVGHLSGENSGDADQGEDKMTKALIREKMPLTLSSMRELATKYFEYFVENLKELNIELPMSFPRASDTIEQDIEFINKLESNGYTYLTSDGLYFDTTKFKKYGELGGVNKINVKTELHGRISANTEKKNVRDFAIWKLSKPTTGVSIGWDSPWGKGFPGWHIECSVMSRMSLGQPFDIHTGGIDHIPVHHNNEIAQSEAAFNLPLTNYWMHNAFITIKDAKMAKSDGNFITLDSLQSKRISPLAYRYWLLTGHYRSPLNFSFSAVESAQKALIRLLSIISNYPDGGNIISDYKQRFHSYINDDLDLPKAVALVWDLINDETKSSADKKTTIIDFDCVLGLNIKSVPNLSSDDLDTNINKNSDIPPEILALADARKLARTDKDWSKSDALRQEIRDRGFDIVDMTDDDYKIIV